MLLFPASACYPPWKQQVCPWKFKWDWKMKILSDFGTIWADFSEAFAVRVTFQHFHHARGGPFFPVVSRLITPCIGINQNPSYNPCIFGQKKNRDFWISNPTPSSAQSSQVSLPFVPLSKPLEPVSAPSSPSWRGNWWIGRWAKDDRLKILC